MQSKTKAKRLDTEMPGTHVGLGPAAQGHTGTSGGTEVSSLGTAAVVPLSCVLLEADRAVLSDGSTVCK